MDKEEIVCLGISGHSLGAVPVDKDGNLLREATPIWSDIRAEEEVEDFFSQGGSGRMVSDHRQRIPGCLLHHLQGDVVPEP